MAAAAKHSPRATFKWQMRSTLLLSGYDAAYVALAHLLKGLWITCDRKAHARVAGLGLSELL